MHSLEEDFNRGMLHDDYDGDMVQNDHNCGIIQNIDDVGTYFKLRYNTNMENLHHIGGS